MQLINRFFFTIKDLKLIQIIGRIKFNLIKPKIKLKKRFIKTNNVASYEIFSFIKKKEFYIKEKKYFNLYILNKIFTFKFNVNWNYSKINKLSLYHINYFNFINSNKNYMDKINTELVEDWITKNKSYNTISLEPYVTSLRIVNWIKWSISNCYTERFFLDSLVNQALWLSKRIEYHIQGNHLISNAKALIFVGLFLKDQKFNQIYTKGINLLNKELKKQILPDGAHFERSPMYHSLIIEDLLDIICIHKTYNKKYDLKILEYIDKMIDWYEDIIHIDNDIPFFNDSCLDNSPTYDQIIKFYADVIGVSRKKIINNQIKLLKDSGFFIYKKNDVSFIMNVGDIKPREQPGHSHADTNSFELSVFGQRIFVNTGISTYDINKRRLFERSTKAHNTVEINNLNSSDVWSSFRVGKKAKVINQNLVIGEQGQYKIICSHNGYKSLFKNIIHTRSCTISNTKLIIEDSINKNYKEAISRLYLHPDIKLVNQELILPNKKSINIKTKNCILKVVKSYWSRSFNEEIENICLEYKILEKKSKIEIIWQT